MPRKYIRKTTKASWTERQLQTAIEAIRNGMKIREAGRKYGIHEATLRKRLKVGVIGEACMGRKAVFTETQEKEMTSHLLLLAKLFYGVTLMELRRIAFDFADKNKIKNNFNQTKKLAGKDWAQKFIQRNPELSLRKPEATSINRILAFNKCEVDKFFNNLRTVMDQYQFPPSRMYNVDETGITTVQKPPSIIGPKGQKQVGSATSLERGRNITVCCAMSATGIFIPPMFIFPGVRASAGIKRGGPAGSIFEMSKSGWMTEDLFLLWLKHFVSNTQSSLEQPTLILMDNHSSHTSLESYNLCKENGIVVVSFPPHTSHRLQPLDLTFFGPLKSAYNRECALFMRNNGFQRIYKEDVPGLFKSAYEKVAGVSKAVSGFGKPGIYPFNPYVFTDEDYLPADVVARPVTERQATVEVEDTPCTASPQTEKSSDKDSNGVPDDRLRTEHVSVPITEISPIPRPSTSQGVTSTSRAKQHSEILTATPRKTMLELLKEKRDKKKATSTYKASKTVTINKKGAAKKVLFDDSSSDEEEEYLSDSSQDDELDVSTLPKKNATNNTCLFCGEFGRDNELWYRCVLCSGWVHSDCSAADTAHNFVCDFCA